MGNYGELPITGAGVITVGGIALNSPWIAGIGFVLIVGGALLMRRFRPVRLDATDRSAR